MPHLLILTEAGPSWGAGHLTRCSALAKAFENLGWSTKTLVQSEPTGYGALPPAEIVPWHTNREIWQREARNTNLILLDSYMVPTPIFEEIASSAPFFSAIDDYPRRDYQRGYIIDWSMSAEAYAYPQRRHNVTYYLGSHYACLRPPFWETAIHRPTKINRILVMFGSSDIRNLTTPALLALTATFPDTKIDVVAGSGMTPSELRSVSHNPNVEYHSSLDAIAMRQLMLGCDVAISGGGQALYELAACGTPTVAIELADNQRDDLLHFAAAGLIDFVGHWNNHDIWANALAAISELERSPGILTKRSCLGQSLIDGQGANRLAQQIATASGLFSAPFLSSPK